MLDLAQQMEVSYKVNKMIKKANEALNLCLHQPHITYKLKGTADVARSTGNTINFNTGLINLITADIQDQVAHIINFELNNEHDSKSVTYQNILKLLTGNADIVVDIKPRVEAPKKVVTKAKAKTGSIKEKAVSAYEKAMTANKNITRQEMVDVLYKEFNLDNDPKGKMKASNYYTTAKKFAKC